MYCNSVDFTVVKTPHRLRKNLLFFRAAGATPWPFLAGWEGAQRNFDIAVNYYSPPEPGSKLHENADFILAGGLSKFHAAQLFLQNSPLLSHYKYIMLADDDVEFYFSVDHFITFCETQSFTIAQPSLTHDSYYSFEITRHHPGLLYRTTNFVEEMCPLFEASHLRRVIGKCDQCISAWGLGVYWAVALQEGQLAAVVDAFQMRHYRPIAPEQGGGKYYQILDSMGINRWAELRRILAELNMANYRIMPKSFVYKEDLVAIPPGVLPPVEKLKTEV